MNSNGTTTPMEKLQVRKTEAKKKRLRLYSSAAFMAGFVALFWVGEYVSAWFHILAAACFVSGLIALGGE